MIGRVAPVVTATDESTARRGDPERVEARDHRIGAVATGVVIAIWVLLVVWRPTVTFHLAPVFAGAAWPVALRRGAPLRVAGRDAALGAVGSGAATVAVVLALWQLDLLRGPTLWESQGAIVEVLPAAVLGAVGGYRYARCGQSA